MNGNPPMIPGKRGAFANFIKVPLGLLCYPGLTEGAKLVLIRLFGYAGNSENCWPTVERLAADLHVSKRSIERWLPELTREKFIRSKRQGQGKPPVYTLLSHPCFDPPNLADQTDFHPPDLAGQANPDPPNSVPSPARNGGSRPAKFGIAYKEELDSVELDSEVDSSSSSSVLRVVECGADKPQPRTEEEEEFPSQKLEKPKPTEAGAKLVEQAREILRKARAGGFGKPAEVCGKPSPEITRQFLAVFSSLALLSMWAQNFGKPFRPRSCKNPVFEYKFMLTDAKNSAGDVEALAAMGRETYEPMSAYDALKAKLWEEVSRDEAAREAAAQRPTKQQQNRAETLALMPLFRRTG